MNYHLNSLKTILAQLIKIKNNYNKSYISDSDPFTLISNVEKCIFGTYSSLSCETLTDTLRYVII